jgi:hypothetical protein
MPSERLIEVFLTKAAEAETRATTIFDNDLQESWRAMAQQYRSLAKRVEAKRKFATAQQPIQ